MANLIPQIRLVDGKPMTTSRHLAEYFHKRHDDVLKKINSLECSEEFTARNFAVSEYKDLSGKKNIEYQITRDGFAFIAMGFTGKKAAKFKEDYIGAFNKMEAALLEQKQLCFSLPRINATDRRILMQVIKFYLSLFNQMTTSFERGALVAYLNQTKSDYTIEKAVKYKTGLDPENVFGLLTDNKSVLVQEDASLRVSRVGTSIYKWFYRYIERSTPFGYIDHIPE